MTDGRSRWEIERGDQETVVTMARRLPDQAAGLSADELRAISADIARLPPCTMMEELAENSRQRTW